MASYTSHKLTFEESYMITGGRNYSYSWAYKDFEENQSAVSFKIGFEL